MEASLGSTIILIPLSLSQHGQLPDNWYWIIVIYYIVNLSLASYFGYLSDRIGRRKMLVFGTFISILSFLPFPFYQNPNDLIILLFANALKGIGAAAYSGPIMALFADFAPKEGKGEFMGLYYLSRSAGGAIGIFLSVVLWTIFNNDAYFFFAILLMFATQIFLVIKEPRASVDLRALQFSDLWKIQVEGENISPELEINPLILVLETLKSKEFRTFSIVWLIFSSIVGIGITYTAAILKLRNIDPIFAVIPILAIAVIVGATQTRFGALSDRHGRKPFMLLGISATALLIAIIQGLLLQNNFVEYIYNPLGFSSINIELTALFIIPMPFIVVTGILMLLVLCAATFPSSAMGFLADVTKPGQRGKDMGLIQSLLAIGNILGITLGGFALSEFGILGILTLCFFLAAVSTLIIVLLITETTSFSYLSIKGFLQEQQLLKKT